ncbi:MAG: biotin--[Bacilli bacterium]|nr:biotin--[acetyl-CoA-carboxylase] ligase [Bacilli bacterium]
MGRDYFYYNEIDSTQKEIWRRIDKNEIVNGCIIRAEKQTAGKGTHGRIWYTEENNIAFSLYVELQCNFSKIDGITTQIAEIIVSIIEQMYNIKLEIKLPNDIYINGKKLGGILTETKVKGGVAKFLVVGIGMNNAQLEFSNELNDIATSFKREFALEIDVEEFISSFCNIFESAILERIAR